jgi:DNA modification methylase
VVARDLGRRFVGVELHPEYVALAAARLSVKDGMILRVAA